MTRTALIFVIAFCCAATPGAAWAEEDPNRPYRDGPLTAEDFQAKPDATQSYAAFTQTNFRHRYNYRYRTQGGETTVTLTEIEVWAVVARDKSWNRRLRDALLLDHEQGHFDLSQIYALAAQASLQKRIDQGSALQAKATTQAAAVKLLEERLTAAMKPYVADSLEAHRLYDKQTTNGTDTLAQAEARRDHRQRLEALLAIDQPLAP